MNSSFREDSIRNNPKDNCKTQIIAEWVGIDLENFADDSDTGFEPNIDHHNHHNAMPEGFDDDGWYGDRWNASDSIDGDWPEDDWSYTHHTTQAQAQQSRRDEIEHLNQISQLVKGLLLRFIIRNQYMSAADICGEYYWNQFSEVEQYVADYVIAEYIKEWRLPLESDSTQSYRGLRQYNFRSPNR